MKRASCAAVSWKVTDMKCLPLHCHEELAQLSALTLIVGVGWVELWKCPNHGVCRYRRGRQ